MKHSSLRRNLLALAALYGVSLLVASGCPAQRAIDEAVREPVAALPAPEADTPDDAEDAPRLAAAQPANPPVAREIIQAAAFEPVVEDQLADASEGPKSRPRYSISSSKNDTGRNDKIINVATQGSEKTKFDPIAVNGKYFEGWEKPRLALFISGRQDGYLEPCGCSGLEQQKGGLSRRHSLIKQLRAEGWPVAAVDVGGLVRRFGKQAEIQFSISAEALKTMGYDAVGFGAGDLRLSAGEVAAAVAGPDGGKSKFVSTNVDLFGLTPRFQIVETNGLKLGIAAVLGPTYQKEVNNAELTIEPAEAALEKIWPQIEKCDLKILLAHATMDESKQMGKDFPGFDVVVTAGGADEPPARAMKIPGGGQLIEVGHKGMYAVVLGYYDDLKKPRYQRVALDSRFKNSPAMKQLMTVYQDQLRDLGWAGLGLTAKIHERGQFAGVDSCKKCHKAAFAVWDKTKHAHSTMSLLKADPPRQFDAECVSCHVTGWDPQGFFPYKSGFISLEKTAHLADNSCENCHGPGAAHVAAEAGKNFAKRDKERGAMKLTTAFAKDNVCNKCHDVDNSPKFDFETFWPKVAHKGKN